MPVHRCPRLLDPGHSRAGEPCGRRYMPPFEACEAHRPAPPTRTKPRTEATRALDAKHRARFRRARASAGLPEGW